MTPEQELAQLLAMREVEEDELLDAFLPELAEKIEAVLAAGGSRLQVLAELRSAMRMFKARRAEERAKSERNSENGGAG